MRDIITCLNPVIIHYYQRDVEKAIRNNWQRRGDDWKKWFISKELFSDFDFRKIQIENSKNDWEFYRKQIIDFLELPMTDEHLFDDSFEKFKGYYSGLKIHIKNNRLCLNVFWPNLKLLPITENEFEHVIRDNFKMLRSNKVFWKLYYKLFAQTKVQLLFTRILLLLLLP